RAAITAGEERAVSDIYEGLRSAGLPLLRLSGALYEVTASPAQLATSCKVSLSADKADEYDVVVAGPGGLSAPANAAPQRCRWMARHAPSDTINPARHAAGSVVPSRP
ncbi:MAG TPA: hypothetical protein VD906_10030, partial [Caulobacteraceae bacterium]|nr:hypothetical protein [Caulobacteraceae bacterium]